MTSLRQGRLREGSSEGSPRQSCEPRNTNAIEGRLPWGETAQHVEALWFGGYGKWRGCAATVHALIRGDLLDEVGLADGAVRPLTDRRGPDHSPAMSPDGRKIAYLGFDDRAQGYQARRWPLRQPPILAGDPGMPIEDICEPQTVRR